MDSINYLRILTKKESSKMNKDMVKWVKKTLDAEDGYELYNILRNLQGLFEKISKGS